MYQSPGSAPTLTAIDLQSWYITRQIAGWIVRSASPYLLPNSNAYRHANQVGWLAADWKRLMLDHVIPAIPDFSWSHATGGTSLPAATVQRSPRGRVKITAPFPQGRGGVCIPAFDRNEPHEIHSEQHLF